MTQYKVLFPLLFVALVSVAVQAQDASSILNQTAERYKNASAYLFRGTVDVLAYTGTDQQRVDMQLFMVRQGSNFLRIDLNARGINRRIYSLRDSTIIYEPLLNSYTVHKGPFDPTWIGTTLPDYKTQYGALADSVQKVTAVPGILERGDQSVPVDILTIEYQPRPTQAGADSSLRTVWIDRDKGVILKEQLHGYLSSTSMGALWMDENVEFSEVRIDEQFPDTTFFFKLPPGSEPAVAEAESGSTPSPLDGRPAPNFSLAYLEGGEAKLGDFAGKVVLMNFWATWCGPCQAEMPLLEALYNEYKDRGLVMLAVNVAEEQARVSKYIKDKSLSMPVLMDTDGGVANLYGAYGIPTSVVIRPDGTVSTLFMGARNEEYFRRVIEEAGLSRN